MNKNYELINVKPLKEGALLSPKLDVIFKILFGNENHKEILIDFLKSILNEPDDEIEELRVLNPFTIKEYKNGKQGILDVKVGMKSGGKIDIEIQILNTHEMPERSLFYLSKIYEEQFESGKNFSEGEKAISILISDFTFLPEARGYHNTFWFINPENGVKFSDMMEIHVLEMSKLPKQSDNTRVYDWMKFINAESEEDYKMLAENNNAIKEAYDQLKRLSLDDENRQVYEDRFRALFDEAWGRAAAKRAGLKEGKAEGIAENQVETARKLLERNFSIEDVADITGLKTSEVQSLINK